MRFADILKMCFDSLSRRKGRTIYADAALTQPIDDTVSIDTNGEEMTVYVVPDVPLN